MADNDKIKIIKETMPSIESNGVTIILHNKMIREYEDIIFQLAKQAVTAEGLAKDICDRLFGEGE